MALAALQKKDNFDALYIESIGRNIPVYQLNGAKFAFFFDPIIQSKIHLKLEQYNVIFLDKLSASEEISILAASVIAIAKLKAPTCHITTQGKLITLSTKKIYPILTDNPHFEVGDQTVDRKMNIEQWSSIWINSHGGINQKSKRLVEIVIAQIYKICNRIPPEITTDMLHFETIGKYFSLPSELVSSMNHFDESSSESEDIDSMMTDTATPSSDDFLTSSDEDNSPDISWH